MFPESLKNDVYDSRDSLQYAVQEVDRALTHIISELYGNYRLTDSKELQDLRNSLYQVIYKYRKD